MNFHGTKGFHDKNKKEEKMLVIKSNIRKQIPKEMRVGVEVANALDARAQEILKRAVERAKANKRTTILPQDL